MTKDLIGAIFFFSSFKHLKVFHKFKKMILDNAYAEDVDMLKRYLFQMEYCGLYENDPKDFVSVIDCSEFCAKYLDELLAINNMKITTHIIDTKNDAYGLCKNCYTAFCIDLLIRLEKMRICPF